MGGVGIGGMGVGVVSIGSGAGMSTFMVKLGCFMRLFLVWARQASVRCHTTEAQGGRSANLAWPAIPWAPWPVSNLRPKSLAQRKHRVGALGMEGSWQGLFKHPAVGR